MPLRCFSYCFCKNAARASTGNCACMYSRIASFNTTVFLCWNTKIYFPEYSYPVLCHCQQSFSNMRLACDPFYTRDVSPMRAQSFSLQECFSAAFPSEFLQRTGPPRKTAQIISKPALRTPSCAYLTHSPQAKAIFYKSKVSKKSIRHCIST